MCLCLLLSLPLSRCNAASHHCLSSAKLVKRSLMRDPSADGPGPGRRQDFTGLGWGCRGRREEGGRERRTWVHPVRGRSLGSRHYSDYCRRRSRSRRHLFSFPLIAYLLHRQSGFFKENEKRGRKQESGSERERREEVKIGHNQANQLNSLFLCLGPEKCI